MPPLCLDTASRAAFSIIACPEQTMVNVFQLHPLVEIERGLCGSPEVKQGEDMKLNDGATQCV